jgi:hypothetical protein
MSLSSLGFGTGTFEAPLIIKSINDLDVDSHLKLDHFIVYYPLSMPVALLRPLLKLNTLLNNNDALFETFRLGVPPEDLKQTFSDKQLAIRFVGSKKFNEFIIPLREVHGDDVCCGEELGWFDYRISANSVYINYDYCQTDGSNNVWLEMMIFITTMHELSHFLVYHSKIDSPTQSLFEEEKTEAGECWEIHNLGGSVNHAAKPKSRLLVEWLHTHTATGDRYLSLTSIDQLNMVMNGELTFPLNLDSTDEDVAGLQKFKSDRHCVENPSIHRPFIPYTGPKLIMHQKKPDRKGPRRK